MKNLIKTLIKSLSVKEKKLKKNIGKSISDNLSELQNKIGYTFKDDTILKIALIHTSCYYKGEEVSQSVSEYERMEFLGDSVLGLITSEFLYSKFVDKNEGFLSKLKSQIVSENYLSIKAKKIGLGKYILLGEDEFKDRGYEKKSILANMMESLICSIYLDGDIAEAKRFIQKHILTGYKEELTSDIHINYKSKLQEYSQMHYKQLPIYKVIATEGPDHKKIFSVTVNIQGKQIGLGTGSTKKNAEQDAAKEGCQLFQI